MYVTPERVIELQVAPQSQSRRFDAKPLPSITAIAPATSAVGTGVRGRIREVLASIANSSLWSKVKQAFPFILSGGIIGLNLLVNAPCFLVGMSIAGLTYKIISLLVQRSPRLSQMLSRIGLKAKSPQARLLLALAFAGGLTLTITQPAQALFFGAAETWFNAQFPDAAAAIPLVFSVLRGLFVLYIGVSLIRVINAVRNDDDWQTIARTPLMVAVCVSVGEVLTNLIIA